MTHDQDPRGGNASPAAPAPAPGSPRVHPADAAACRERLAALAAGPAPGALRAAPLLEGWLVLTAPGPLPLRLAGVCTGHPRIADGWLTTSPLLGIEDRPEGLAARTWSRWYRLAPAPVPAGVRELLAEQRRLLERIAEAWPAGPGTDGAER